MGVATQVPKPKPHYSREPFASCLKPRVLRLSALECPYPRAGASETRKKDCHGVTQSARSWPELPGQMEVLACTCLDPIRPSAKNPSALIAQIPGLAQSTFPSHHAV